MVTLAKGRAGNSGDENDFSDICKAGTFKKNKILFELLQRMNNRKKAIGRLILHQEKAFLKVVKFSKIKTKRTSLVVQWLRLRLPMQEVQV